MTFDLEIMLRNREHVFTERVFHDRDPEQWTETDVDAVLRKILAAIDHVLNPGDVEDRPVNLRGLSWIVNPYKDGVVIALEIHSASAVAGPFAIAQPDLERMVARAVRAGQPRRTVH